MTTQLVNFDRARVALAEAHSIDKVKLIRDQAEAMRQYIRVQGGSLKMQNQAAEIKIRAERRAGEMLKDMEFAQGKRTDIVTPCNQVNNKPLLEDLGITKIQSHRWQLEAEVPESQVEQFILEANEKAEELTSRAILTMAIKAKHEVKKEQTGVALILRTLGIR